MFLAEPPPTQGDVHFSLLGFPVRIQFFFWVTTAFMGWDPEPIMLLSWVAAVLLCILLHELGHALVMRYYGADAAIVLYYFGGLAIPRPGRFGYRQPGPSGQILISLAGPATGFILAGVLVAALHYLGHLPVEFPEVFHGIVPVVYISNNLKLTNFFYFIFQISIIWGLINLLPVYPLDGGQVAQQIFLLYDRQDPIRHSLILSVLVAGAMCLIAFVQWHANFMGLLFLGLAFTSYMSLQSHRGW